MGSLNSINFYFIQKAVTPTLPADTTLRYYRGAVLTVRILVDSIYGSQEHQENFEYAEDLTYVLWHRMNELVYIR